MALNPKPRNYNWNYSRPKDPGFSTSLTGTVVFIQEVQAMEFGQNGPTVGKFWPDGNPRFNARIGLCGPNGGLRTLTFAEAGKKAKQGLVKSLHMDLFKIAGGEDITKLIGMTIRISTEQPPQGFSYGTGNPRPWNVEIVEEGPYQLREPLPAEFQVPQVLANASVHGGQTVQPQGYPVQMPQYAPQQMPQQAPQQAVYQAPQPTAYQAPQPAPQPQPEAQSYEDEVYEDVPF